NTGAEYAGRVGIGNMIHPSATLHVSGTIRFADSGEDCDGNRTGAIRYTSSSVFQFCHGSGWVSLADAAGGGIASDRITSGTTSIVANEDTSITFTTAGTQRMVLTGQGFLGVNTMSATAPVSLYK